MENKIKNEIINDIINIVRQSENETDIVHIDNLIEEIEENPNNFKYTVKQLKEVLNQIFY